MQRLLNHTRVVSPGSEPRQWLYVVHGIYGSGRNWGSLARRLVQERPAVGVILVDLRLHGDSTGFEPPHTLDACARDLGHLEQHLELPASLLLGHSFGGKVVLLRAAADGPVPEQVWVADSTLRTGSPSGTAWKVVEIVRSLPDTFPSREALADEMVAHGYERAVGQWLAMNLEREGEVFRWKLDWQGVEEMLRDYFATDVWPIVEEPPEGTRIHILKASESNALDEESVGRILAAGESSGRVDVHVLKGGHWINVDNPEGVLELILERV
jgi:esterase